MKLHNKFLSILLLFQIFYIAPAVAYTDNAKTVGTINVNINEETTQKGLKYWYVKNHDLSIISMEIAFKKAGHAYDPINKQGLSSLVSEIIKEGAGNNDATSLAKQLENRGIELEFDVSKEYFHVYMKTLSENLDKALSLLSDCLLRPTIDEESFKRVYYRQSMTIDQLQKNPRFKANIELSNILFKNHPYSNNIYGTADTLKNINREDLLQYVKTALDKNNLVISVVGDINDSQKFSDLLDEYLFELPYDVNNMSNIEEPTYSKQNSYHFMDIPQSVIVFGQKGIHRLDVNYYKAYILNHALGGLSLNSILMKELRDKQGITYSTRTYLDCNEHGNILSGVLYTDNSSARKSIDTIKKIIKNIKDNGIDKALFDVAKDNIINSFMLSLSSNDEVAHKLTDIQLQGLGIDYINKRNDLFQKVTLDEVNKFAKEFISPDNLSFVEVSKKNNLVS